MNPNRDPWPSVADHPAEQMYREAAEAGAACVYWMRLCAAHFNADEGAVRWAQVAAGLYHEAQRLSGICPEHGDEWPCAKEGCA